jgi:hypothetical protein
LVGLTRTTSSPGTPLRRPYSSARSAHVATARPCRDVENLLRILADRGDALDLDKRVGRTRIIDTHHHTWITCQRTAFRGDLAGVERQFAVVDDKPNWCHKGAAVGSEITEQSRAGAFG